MRRRDFLSSVGLGASAGGFEFGSATQVPAPNRVTLREDRYKDTPSFVIESDIIRSEFVAHGGRMVSLRDKRINHEFLFQQKEAKYIRGQYDSPMAINQAAGYDDMFPTIAECHVDQYPWKGIPMPDHGEVWSTDWHVEKAMDALTLSIHGIRLPYRLTRRITLSSPNRLRMAYKVENFSPFVMPYLWSAHAMLQPEQGARIRLPQEARVATVGMSHSGRLGKYGDRITWPTWTDAQGKQHDLSTIRSPKTDDVEAYTFARPLTHGTCGLHWPSVNRTLTLFFPVDTVPFLTVLVGEGQKTDPRFFALLEPCSAPFGRLDLAKSYTKDSVVSANGSREWYLDFEVSGS